MIEWAGVTGVEPAETRFGDECLTVWRHPYECATMIAEPERLVKAISRDLSELHSYRAERERFELSEAFPPQRFSKPPH